MGILSAFSIYRNWLQIRDSSSNTSQKTERGDDFKIDSSVTDDKPDDDFAVSQYLFICSQWFDVC